MTLPPEPKLWGNPVSVLGCTISQHLKPLSSVPNDKEFLMPGLTVVVVGEFPDDDSEGGASANCSPAVVDG